MHALNLILDGLLVGGMVFMLAWATYVILDTAFPARTGR